MAYQNMAFHRISYHTSIRCLFRCTDSSLQQQQRLTILIYLSVCINTIQQSKT